MKKEFYAIAIDGPSGAGKSTMAKILAANLKITYLDTGAMYRAAAVYATKQGIDVNDRVNVIKLLDTLDIGISYEDGHQTVSLNGEDVSLTIREPWVSMKASDISKIPEVRTKLVDLQRKIAAGKNVVMDGRDIATCVLPDAQVKIFLTASAEARAQRRHAELLEKGNNISYQEVYEDIIRRDENDMNRAVSPLRQAEDAILLDTSDLNIEQSVMAIEEIVKQRGVL
ncbi:MAG: (d)CMP kinase [Ruminococcaceae bacterium]|nr:(d)CMP kinase [Oscillospiraceae bacterium]